MVSPRRPAGPGAGNKGTAARPSTTRAAAPRDPGAPPPLSTPRRLGVLVVVGALVASILLAFGGSGRPNADPTPRPPSVPPSLDAGPTPSPTPVGPPPTVTPVIVPPDSAVLTERRATLTVTIPEPGQNLRSLQLRIYRNENALPDAVRVRDLTMVLRNVPLRRGENRLTVALINAGGEGPRSEPVVLTVDDRPPRIAIREPDDGAVVNAPVATVRGVTDPDLAVTIRNPDSGFVGEAQADERGVFLAEVRLDPGPNRIVVEALDAAGNRTAKQIGIRRGDEVPEAVLFLSEGKLKVRDLPTSINVRLQLTDPDGRPLDGAMVHFSISVPGMVTDTFEARTVNGSARWDDVRIPASATKGNGFVTARVELGSGIPPAVATIPLVIE